MLDIECSTPSSSALPSVTRHFALGAFAAHPEHPDAPLAVSGSLAAFDVALELEGFPHVGASLTFVVRVVVDLARTSFVENHESPIAPVVASEFPAELHAAMAHLSADDAGDVRDTIEEMCGVAAGGWFLDSVREDS